MEITFSPSALPGSCYFCGSGNREFYIDTKLSVEFHGAMYICNICAEELARLVRFIPHDEYKEILAEKEQLEEHTYQLRVQLDGFQGAIDAFVRAGYNINTNLTVSRSGGAVLEADDLSDETVSTRESELGTGEGTPSESSDDEDVGKLRSDDSELKPVPDLFGFLGDSQGTK
jgi:hypothetical protein